MTNYINLSAIWVEKGRPIYKAPSVWAKTKICKQAVRYKSYYLKLPDSEILKVVNRRFVCVPQLLPDYYNFLKGSPSLYTVVGDIAYINLCDKDGILKNRAIIDAFNLPLTSSFRWNLTKSGYAVRRIKDTRKQVFMHREIFADKNAVEVDHINRNRLDNRLSNLRAVTTAENAMNRGLQSNNTSGTPGVYWIKSENKWKAEIKINGVIKRLGRFINLGDAVNARLSAEETYFGEFSPASRDSFNCNF